MIFLLLQIPESQVICRFVTTYICNTLSIIYALTQLPSWRFNLLVRQLYWSTIKSSSILAALLAYLIVIFLQNSMIFPEKTPLELDQTPKYSLSHSNLNWIFLENSFLVKLVFLFIFQSIAYHAACVENAMMNLQQPPFKRRCG